MALVLRQPRGPGGNPSAAALLHPAGSILSPLVPLEEPPPWPGLQEHPRAPPGPVAPRLPSLPRAEWDGATGGMRGLSLPPEQHRERAGKKEKKAEEGKEAGEGKREIKKKNPNQKNPNKKKKSSGLNLHTTMVAQGVKKENMQFFVAQKGTAGKWRVHWEIIV